MNLAILFTTATAAFGLPPGLLTATCYVESHHNIRAIHKDDGNGNSLGVCQIKLPTAKMLGFRGKELELMNPSTNVKYAAKYLAYQLRRYESDPVKAICAYNSGSYRENALNQPVNLVYLNRVIKAWLKKK
jgi:soluble lytic murein transglycosylase-like protein